MAKRGGRKNGKMNGAHLTQVDDRGDGSFDPRGAERLFERALSLKAKGKTVSSASTGELNGVIETLEEECHFDPTGVRQCLIIDRMEEERRAVFLRTFDNIRELRRWDDKAQGDLVDEAERQNAAN